MTVLEKAYELRRQIALAEDISYGVTIAWGNDKEEAINHMNNLINNAIELFGTNRIEDVDYDLRDQVIQDYDIKLENELRRFPQYLETLESAKKGR